MAKIRDEEAETWPSCVKIQRSGWYQNLRGSER